MRRFNELPAMAEPPAAVSPAADQQALKDISAIAMRCGGCGAKVGATVLSRALGSIEPAARDDVVVGLDAPDDAALVDVGGDKLSLQTVDYFRAIVDDPYTLGKIAANHSLGDVYAMGGEPQTALAIATVPYGLEAKVEADLSAMMAGANEVLRAAGCALVGGHTSEGAELALGFAINGLVPRADALRKAGLRPGDALILTKPIGTGTLLAADMRGKAKARWVMAAIAHMVQSNGRAADILRRHGVHAATDVTGFGLIGHLVEMVRASNVDVTVAVDRVPLLDGARETVALGIFSSLQPQNVRLRRAVRELETVAKHPRYPLLFDPQTAGGLLAAVPLGAAERCVAELRASGYAGADVVGLVSERSGALEPVTLDLTGERVARALAQAARKPQDDPQRGLAVARAKRPGGSQSPEQIGPRQLDQLGAAAVDDRFGGVEAEAERLLGLDLRRHGELHLGRDHVDQSRPVVRERLLQRRLELRRVLDPVARQAGGLRDLGEVRIVEIGPDIEKTRRLHLHVDEAEQAVVEHHDLHRQAELAQREHVAHQHGEAAVARHRDDLAAGARRLHADRLRQGIRHRAVQHRAEQAPPALEMQVACGPDRGFADVAREHRIADGDLVDDLGEILRVDRLAAGLPRRRARRARCGHCGSAPAPWRETCRSSLASFGSSAASVPATSPTSPRSRRVRRPRFSARKSICAILALVG